MADNLAYILSQIGTTCLEHETEGGQWLRVWSSPGLTSGLIKAKRSELGWAKTGGGSRIGAFGLMNQRGKKGNHLDEAAGESLDQTPMPLPETSIPESGEGPSWDALPLAPPTLELLYAGGYRRPTPIQAAAIPQALRGGDLIACAQTGTGKTIGFVLPMIERIRGKEGTLGLVLAPTREIAQQIQAVFDALGTPQGVRAITLIGGINLRQDTVALASYPQVIVATPGRLCDHLDRGNVWVDFVRVVVLDEADRMLDMGFASQLARIMQDVPRDAQRWVFSATISPSVKQFSGKILSQPAFVQTDQNRPAASTVEQRLKWVSEEEKLPALRRLLQQETGSVVVFCRSKDGAIQLYRTFHSRGHQDMTVIHSDLRQRDREQVLADYKIGKYRVLVATDIAGRGIHVDGITHVVNYDLPREPEDYIHRIGRTGRNSASGRATTLATERDRRTVEAIEALLGHPIPEIGTRPSPREEPRKSTRHSSTAPQHSAQKNAGKRPQVKSGAPRLTGGATSAGAKASSGKLAPGGPGARRIAPRVPESN